MPRIPESDERGLLLQRAKKLTLDILRGMPIDREEVAALGTAIVEHLTREKSPWELGFECGVAGQPAQTQRQTGLNTLAEYEQWFDGHLSGAKVRMVHRRAAETPRVPKGFIDCGDGRMFVITDKDHPSYAWVVKVTGELMSHVRQATKEELHAAEVMANG